MSTQVDGPVSTQINELINMEGEEEKTASKLENSADANETSLMKLFAAPQFDNSAQEEKWLKDNGLGTYKTVEGARDALQLKQKRIERALSAFQELMYSSHQIMMEMIRKLRVN